MSITLERIPLKPLDLWISMLRLLSPLETKQMNIKAAEMVQSLR